MFNYAYAIAAPTYSVIQAGGMELAARKTDIARLTTITTIASIIFDLISIIFCFASIAPFCKNPFVIPAEASFSAKAAPVVLAIAGSVTMFVVVIGIVALVNRYFKLRESPQELLAKRFPNLPTPVTGGAPERVVWEKPSVEILAQFFLFVKTAMHVSLALLSPGGALAFGISAACNGYSLMRMAQRRWLAVKQDAVQLQNTSERARATFYFLLLPYKGDSQAVCPECKDPEPDIHFCEAHPVHTACAIKIIDAKKDSLLNGISNIKLWLRRSGEREEEYYKADLPKASLPTCPQCNEPPCNGTLDATLGGLGMRITYV